MPTLAEIVSRLGGELIGDPDVMVTRVATLDGATSDSITFLANEKYTSQLTSTRAGAVVVGPAFRDCVTVPHLVAENPYAYFAKVSALLNPLPAMVPGVHATAVVHESAIVDGTAEIGPMCVIDQDARIGARVRLGSGVHVGARTVIGDDTRMYSRVCVYHDIRIGSRVIVHAGAVLGADGFGIAMDEGRWLKVPQVGTVVIGDDVEIGANTTIDRGAIEDTVIEDGVKLDNQIQVAHNVHIGAHTAIAACVGIAGSSKIGRYCRIGGAAGIAGHLSICDHVEISAFTLITRSIRQPGSYTGAYPFEANGDWRRNAAQLPHLSEIARRVRALEKQEPKRTDS